jgi:acyl-CoA synthetase (AMP-forming)/AMP-acid ligase II
LKIKRQVLHGRCTDWATRKIAANRVGVPESPAFKGTGETEATRARSGWLHTGDIGKLDDEGYLYILDRKKDMINRGGEKIYSLEVENVIFRHPKVLEVAVVGVPDKFFGEAVKAAIVLRPGETADEEEFRSFCSGQLADYKVPRYIEFLDSLPRNPAGKVIKGELKYIKKDR